MGRRPQRPPGQGPWPPQRRYRRIASQIALKISRFLPRACAARVRPPRPSTVCLTTASCALNDDGASAISAAARPGYNKPIKRFAVRAVMMMRRTKKAGKTEERTGACAGWTGRMDRAEPIYLLPNVLTGVTLSVRGHCFPPAAPTFEMDDRPRPSRGVLLCSSLVLWPAGLWSQFNRDGISEFI